jgi:hypothetical protein
MNKRGQFYLIAALVIVGIIVGLATVYNSAKSVTEDSTIYDLSDEINFEGSQILASGLFNADSETDMNSKIINLTDYYARSNPESELLIVYGNSTNLTYVAYTNSITGSISIAGGISIVQTSHLTKRIGTVTVTGSTVEVYLSNNVQYTFRIKPGYQFYLIMKKEKGGETFVSTPGGNQPTIGAPSQNPCQNLFASCTELCESLSIPSCLSSCETMQGTCLTSGCTWQQFLPCVNIYNKNCTSENCISRINQCNEQLFSCSPGQSPTTGQIILSQDE